MALYTLHDLIVDLRGGKYTSTGSYPKYWLTDDGSTVSYEAIKADVWHFARATRDNERQGWCVVGCCVNWEDPELYCDVTGNRIESAYAEPNHIHIGEES